MNKHFKIIISVAVALTMAFGMTALVACGGDFSGNSDSSSNSSSAAVTTKYNVTFNYNYDGASNELPVEVESGSMVAKPADPTRTGYTFGGWYTDAECMAPFDFNTEITEHVALYAMWMDEGVSYHTVTLKYNNNAVDGTVRIKDGGRITLTDPEKEGYSFFGWYSNEAYTTKITTGTKITADTTLYARWGQLVTFEAEDVDFSEFSGAGYSNAITGEGAITTSGAVYLNASNGRFVTGLYQQSNDIYNTDLTFVINSSAAVSDAKLTLRLSAEWGDIILDGENYQVLVNGTPITFAESIYLEGSMNSTLGGVTSYDCLPFKDYLINSNVRLNEGENVITLIVNNGTAPSGGGGTMRATAPMVDCLKIASASSVLTWGVGYPIGNY